MALREHEYIKQALERYTNCSLEDFCEHVLITNFKQYIHTFQEKTGGDYHEGNFRIVNAKDLNCTTVCRSRFFFQTSFNPVNMTRQ